MEKEKLSQVLGFDVEKYLAYHAKFYDQKPELDNSPESLKALQYWREYEMFLDMHPDREKAILPVDLIEKVNEASKIITLKTMDNDRLRLRSEGATVISKSDFEKIRNELGAFWEVEKGVLVRSMEAGFSDATAILNERLAACLNEIDLGLFRRKGLFHPIEKQNRKAAFQSLKEILLAKWIWNEQLKGADEIPPKMPAALRWNGKSKEVFYYMIRTLYQKHLIAGDVPDAAKWLQMMFNNIGSFETIKAGIRPGREYPAPKGSDDLDEIFKDL